MSPPDVVVLRGAPDAHELAALLVALSTCSDGPPVPAQPSRGGGPPTTRAGRRGLGVTDRFWFTGYSPR